MLTGELHDPKGLLIELRGLKQQIGEQLQVALPEADVHITDYYNNTFFPDYVITWPGDVVLRRYVYLKGSANPTYLAQDADHADFHPAIFIVLATVDGTDTKALQRLRERLVDTGHLMLEQDALSALATTRGAAKLLRTGRGFYRTKLVKA